jgi:hypothetical protein
MEQICDQIDSVSQVLSKDCKVGAFLQTWLKLFSQAVRDGHLVEKVEISSLLIDPREQLQDRILQCYRESQLTQETLDCYLGI